MKTIEEFIKEIESSDALKNELNEVKDKDALASFLKKHNVNATAEEFKNALNTEGEIGDNDAQAIAGGGLPPAPKMTPERLKKLRSLLIRGRDYEIPGYEMGGAGFVWLCEKCGKTFTQTVYNTTGHLCPFCEVLLCSKGFY